MIASNIFRWIITGDVSGFAASIYKRGIKFY